MRCIILILLVVLTSCSENNRIGLSEYKIDKDKEVFQFYITHIKDNDTLIGISIDFEDDKTRIIQSNKCNLGVSILKHQESKSSLFYELTFSELYKNNSGVFRTNLKNGYTFDPNKKIIKENFGFHNLEFLIDTEENRTLIDNSDIFKLWRYIFGSRFNLKESEYKLLMVLSDKKTISVTTI